MKEMVNILIGLFFSISVYSQTDVKVRVLPSKIATETEMLIPIGSDFLYERYSYFKHVYWLMERDTLILKKNILEGSKVLINLEVFNQEYDFCDYKINKIRNSALYHKAKSLTEKTAREKIGYDNKEVNEFKREIAISDEIVELTCSNDFPQIMFHWEQSVNDKIEDIYTRKKQRKEWIENNHDKIDKKYIMNFLDTFDGNIPDKESFLEIIIVNLEDLITEIDRKESPYLIYWKLDDLPKSNKLSKAIEVLEKSNLKGKTYRNIKKRLKINES